MKSSTTLLVILLIAICIAGCQKANPFGRATTQQQPQTMLPVNITNTITPIGIGQYTYTTECIGYRDRYDTAFALSLGARFTTSDSILVPLLPLQWGGPLSLQISFQLDGSHHYHGISSHDILDIQVNGDTLYYMEVITRCDCDRCCLWNDTSTYVGLLHR